MIFRRFGKTLKKVSEIGLGLSQFSETKNKNLYGYKSERQVLSVIKYAISKKINIFDTSGGYGDTEKQNRLLGIQSRMATTSGFVRDETDLNKIQLACNINVMMNNINVIGINRIDSYLWY